MKMTHIKNLLRRGTLLALGLLCVLHTTRGMDTEEAAEYDRVMKDLEAIKADELEEAGVSGQGLSTPAQPSIDSMVVITNLIEDSESDEEPDDVEDPTLTGPRQQLNRKDNDQDSPSQSENPHEKSGNDRHSDSPSGSFKNPVEEAESDDEVDPEILRLLELGRQKQHYDPFRDQEAVQNMPSQLQSDTPKSTPAKSENGSTISNKTLTNVAETVNVTQVMDDYSRVKTIFKKILNAQSPSATSTGPPRSIQKDGHVADFHQMERWKRLLQDKESDNEELGSDQPDPG